MVVARYAAQFTGVSVYAAPPVQEPQPWATMPVCPCPAPVSVPLTSDEMRRIIREELAKFDAEKRARKKAKREANGQP